MCVCCMFGHISLYVLVSFCARVFVCAHALCTCIFAHVFLCVYKCTSWRVCMSVSVRAFCLCLRLWVSVLHVFFTWFVCLCMCFVRVRPKAGAGSPIIWLTGTRWTGSPVIQSNRWVTIKYVQPSDHESTFRFYSLFHSSKRRGRNSFGATDALMGV